MHTPPTSDLSLSRFMIVLAQEMDCRGNPAQLYQHLEATATALGGMTPILGPPVSLTSGLHTAMFARTSAGLQILKRELTRPVALRPSEANS